MSPDVAVLLLVGVPTALLLLLRVNASLVFLSACLGLVLLQYIGPDAVDFADMFLPWLNGNNLKLAMLLLPVVLTTVFMIKTVRGSRQLLNVFPALGTGLLLTLITVPLLPKDFASQATESTAWLTLLQFQSLVVGVSAMVCLLFIWAQRPKAGKDKHGKHHPKSHH